MYFLLRVHLLRLLQQWRHRCLARCMQTNLKIVHGMSRLHSRMHKVVRQSILHKMVDLGRPPG